MSLRYDAVISLLRAEMPHFTPDPISQDLAYPTINDFARYICRLAVMGNDDELSAALGFLERCVEEGDSQVQDLMHECIETLAECERDSEIKTRVGPRARRIWNDKH